MSPIDIGLWDIAANPVMRWTMLRVAAAPGRDGMVIGVGTSVSSHDHARREVDLDRVEPVVHSSGVERASIGKT